MKKIPTVFVRDRATGYVTDEVNPECEWVLAGEGVPTRKVDGTCVMFDGTAWWARREVKPGKTPPPGWQQVDHDEVTGKRVGWEPIEQSGFVKFWREAIQIPTGGPARTSPSPRKPRTSKTPDTGRCCSCASTAGTSPHPPSSTSSTSSHAGTPAPGP